MLKTKLLSLFFICATFQLSAQITVNFTFTGAVQTWEVPGRVSTISINAIGAAGGEVGNMNGAGGDASGNLARALLKSINMKP